MPRHARFTHDNRTNYDYGFEYLWLEKVIRILAKGKYATKISPMQYLRGTYLAGKKELPLILAYV
jgi:hypothetical protein